MSTLKKRLSWQPTLLIMSSLAEPIAKTAWLLSWWLLGDFNGDGILDYVSAESRGESLNVRWGEPDDNMSAAQVLERGVSDISVAVGDLNRDGISDLVTATQARIPVRLGSRNGFQPARDVTTLPIARVIALGDVNGDAIPDIVGSSSQSLVLLGNGDGTFADAQYYHLGGAWFQLSVSDVNGDRAPDITAGNQVLFWALIHK
jgi:hypothetical protein